MKYKVIFRVEAQAEAIEAAEYIAAHSHADAAARWLTGLEDAIKSLAIMPTRCGFAREDRLALGAELRQLLFKSHRLIFTIRGGEVHVLHVRHAAREDLGE